MSDELLLFCRILTYFKSALWPADQHEHLESQNVIVRTSTSSALSPKVFCHALLAKHRPEMYSQIPVPAFNNTDTFWVGEYFLSCFSEPTVNKKTRNSSTSTPKYINNIQGLLNHEE
ncbi:MAG: hypothetical protein ACJA2Q_001268 [Pseudohongiellaceae bacterium]